MFLEGLRSGSNRHRQPRTFAVATVVCLLLLALLAVVQVAHIHPLENDADHCPLCIVLHAGLPAAVATAAIVMIPLGRPVPVRRVSVASRPWTPSLFNRPPPTR